jgi:hypothetical protein
MEVFSLRELKIKYSLIDISQHETYCLFNSRREVVAHKKDNSPNAFLHEI